MTVIFKILDYLIHIQQASPIMLPNEWLAWRRYKKWFSKTCDGCHDEKGVYMVAYQDPAQPVTVFYPLTCRLCLDCMCEADEHSPVFDTEVLLDEPFEVERV